MVWLAELERKQWFWSPKSLSNDGSLCLIMKHRIWMCFSPSRDVKSLKSVDDVGSFRIIGGFKFHRFEQHTTTALHCSSTLCWDYCVHSLRTNEVTSREKVWTGQMVKPTPSNHSMVGLSGNVADSWLGLVGAINGKYQGGTRLHKHAQSCKITTREGVK